MTDAKDVPICTCFDDWHANNAENHAPTCPVIAAFATLTRERDAAVDRGLEIQAQLMTMLVQRDAARVVTDAMVARASVALWARYGDHTVEDGDIRAMLTAALTQEDA